MILSTSAVAIDCYVCSKCNDPFRSDNITIRDCDGVCYKAKASIDKASQGVKKGGKHKACYFLLFVKSNKTITASRVNRVIRKPAVFGFSTKTDTNQTVQPQKDVRGLNFQIKGAESGALRKGRILFYERVESL